MSLHRVACRLLVSITLMFSISSIATADECLAYAQKSVEQNNRNLFNQCGFHGSQWSSNSNRWRTECSSMSSIDRAHRLQMREGFLSQCPTVSYSAAGRNHQRKLSFALLKAVESGSLRQTELLVQAGANLSAQPEWLAASPLYTAVKNKSYHLVRFLVRNGAKTHLLAKGEMNVLSLLLQSKDTNYGIFEFLLQNGANPNLLGRQSNKEYPLVLAASKGDLRSSNLLLRYKADPNLYQVRSALQLAVEKDNYPISRALIKGGANPNLGVNGRRCNGIMALDLAFRNAKERVVDLLMDNHALAERECR